MHRPVALSNVTALILGVPIMVFWLAAISSADANGPVPMAPVPIPSESDWIEAGPILQKGPAGAWDSRLEGAISPGALVKIGDTFYLYYIGADGKRSSDRGPRHRALGVATSDDGLHFVKHPGNPIITFLPHNNEEEGIFSVAAMIDSDGSVLLFYGAMSAGTATSTSVTSDVRLAVSNDGRHFRDLGIVMSHADRSVWGFGDELFPVGAFRHEDRYYVYYIAKGKGVFWDLGMAWGADRARLPNSQAVIFSGDYVVGGGDAVYLDEGVIALFLFRVRAPFWNDPHIDIRIATTESPATVSAQIERYEGFNHSLVYFEKDKARWFMYYHAKGAIRARWAVAHTSDHESRPATPDASR